MSQATLNPNQINTSIMGMTSAMFTAVAGTVVTTAVKSNTFIDKTFNVLIHGVAAAEHIADAAERRAKIYGDGIVENGKLAERETTLKHQLRLLALEAQEAQARAVMAKPAKPATPKQPTHKGNGSTAKAASTQSAPATA